jgi:glycine/serine hydroxymethyltransferase
MEEEQLEEIGEMIGRVVRNPDSEEVRDEVMSRVSELLEEFELYAGSEVDY